MAMIIPKRRRADARAKGSGAGEARRFDPARRRDPSRDGDAREGDRPRRLAPGRRARAAAPLPRWTCGGQNVQNPAYRASPNWRGIARPVVWCEEAGVGRWTATTGP